MRKEVFYIDNDTIFKGTILDEEQKIVSASYKTYAKIHFPYLVDQNSGKVMDSIQQFSRIWISAEDIFVTFLDAKNELAKRKSGTIVENVFNIFEKQHYCVFFIHNQNRYKGTLNKEYFFNDVDNLNYFKITDIFEIKYFNKCAMFPADFQTVYLPETKLFSSMSFLKEEYEDELKSLKSSTTPFTGLLKEERYDNTTGIH